MIATKTIFVFKNQKSSKSTEMVKSGLKISAV